MSKGECTVFSSSLVMNVLQIDFAFVFLSDMKFEYAFLTFSKIMLFVELQVEMIH
jgi:hypothetical protein